VRWELVCGHRRLAAARLAGLLMVPCVALDLDDGAARLANVVENLQRKDLSPLEEADGVAALTGGGKTAPEIARLLASASAGCSAGAGLSAITKMCAQSLREEGGAGFLRAAGRGWPRPMQIRRSARSLRPNRSPT
jgi:ParB family chromosome partitioning protein